MGQIKAIFWLVMFFGSVFVGFKFATPYYNYYNFDAGIKDISRFTTSNTEEISAAVIKKADESGVPVTDKNLKITGASGAYIINAQWSVEVNLLDQYKKKLEFKASAP